MLRMNFNVSPPTKMDKGIFSLETCEHKILHSDW